MRYPESEQRIDASESGHSERWEPEIAERLNCVRGGLSIRRFAKPLGVNPETMRRYLTTGRIPAAVVAELALHYKVDCQWLLTGKAGQRVPQQSFKNSQVHTEHALRLNTHIPKLVVAK